MKNVNVNYTNIKYLREERTGRLFVGNRSSNGNEFALLDFFLKGYSLFDGGVCVCTIVVIIAS